MTEAMLALALLAPLLLAVPAGSSRGRLLPAIAALPALVAVVLVPVDTVLALPWLLLGTQFGLDPTGQVFLLGSALLWLSAALYGADTLPGAGRFRLFFTLAMTGNFSLVLAQDAITFYLGFALMGLAAAGLVAERNAAGTRRAARSYLAWTILGEVSLFTALVMLVSGAAGSGFEQLRAAGVPHAALFLLLVGFGIKVALPGLHAWMPQAYQAAPAAGSAVLGGAMVNAGVLGWLRLLPTGETGYGDWGYALFVVGLVGAFYGVVFGLLQRRPKVVLAYSSMSQMGLLSAAIGLALAEPQQAPLLLAAVMFYALHHGLAKGALFLTTDAYERRHASVPLFVLLVLLALTLAGAPLTSGALAKGAYKAAIPDHMGWLQTLLAASTLATTLLMMRFLVLVRRQRARPETVSRANPLPVILLAGSVILLPLLTSTGFDSGPMAGSPWPIIAGAALAAALAWRPIPTLQRLVGEFPPGDLPALIGCRISRRLSRGRFPSPPNWRPGRCLSLGARAGVAEMHLRQWPAAGALWLLLLGLLVVALVAFR